MEPYEENEPGIRLREIMDAPATRAVLLMLAIVILVCVVFSCFVRMDSFFKPPSGPAAQAIGAADATPGP